jgi:hypothetical protein
MEIVSRAELSISYDGEMVRTGLMDVRELAPALLASGNLLQKANLLLNGDNTQIELKVRSDFRRGSFVVDLHVVQGLLEQAKGFLALHPNIKEAKDILEILFFYGGLPITTIGGVFKLIKKFGNRKPDSVVIENNTGTVILALGDQHFTTNKTSYELFLDPEVRRAANTLVAPLESEGIDELKITRGDDVEIVTKEEAPSFSYSPLEGELLLDSTKEAWLSIISLSFNSNLKWRFNDGGITFTANIHDEEFWKRIRKHEERFEESDQLLVNLRVTTARNDKGDLQTIRVVEKVLKHIHAPKQQKLDL